MSLEDSSTIGSGIGSMTYSSQQTYSSQHAERHADRVVTLSKLLERTRNLVNPTLNEVCIAVPLIFLVLVALGKFVYCRYSGFQY